MHIILLIVAFFSLGLGLRRFVPRPAQLVQSINLFIIYVAFPALILLKVPTLPLDSAVMIPALFVWTWALFTLFLIRFLARRLSWRRDVEGATILLVSMGNTAFVGVPLSLIFFNDTVMGYAVFYDQFGSFLVLSTLGILVIANYAGDSRAKPSGMSVLKGVVSFPPFIALMIALFAPLEGLPSWIGQGFTWLSAPLMPLALVVLGVQFQPNLLSHHRQPLAAVLLLKLLLAPLAALAILKVLQLSIDIPEEVLVATVFQTAMPSMITPGLLAIAAGLAPRFVTTALGYGTVLAFVLIPLWAWMLGWQP